MNKLQFIIPWRTTGDPWRERSLTYIMRHYADVRVLGFFDSDPSLSFNRSQARNHVSPEAGTVVFLDADSVVPIEQLLHAIEMVDTQQAQWVLPYTDYYNLTAETTERFFDSEYVGGRWVLDSADYVYHFPSQSHPEPAVGGCVVVSSGAFHEVHGYDERFLGWGEEDRAFILALETLVHPIRRVIGDLYHLWHEAPETVRFEQPNFEHNRALCNRYREAKDNPKRMAKLVLEH